MKKIIGGKTYNTETAKEMGSFTKGNMSDFAYCAETLYRNNRGTWFLHGEGGPASPYCRRVGQNEWAGGEKIIPMTEDEARSWAEKHLSADEYEAIFGETEEADPSDLTTRSRVNVVLDNELYALIKGISSETGTPVSRLLDRAIRETYGGDKEG